ncbi:hypothetical protein C8034_v003506 [Colletotrichum sidae]|uniref:TNT domain-containing protein n=1 Tax=Colletotrichum sidae TaxID=1347389 RepID=A0A4R8TA62_9PEZI|nr:hypothetical protein C8034_v003506 [Colletotrichum sidae]
MHVSAVSSLLFGAAVVVFGSPVMLKRDSDLEPSRCPEFCAGTNRTETDPELYICGDPRLGPVSLPSGIPLEGIVGVDSTYRRFGGLCPGQFLAEFTDREGKMAYPPFEGYGIDTAGRPAVFNLTLTPGTYVDRFGSEFGRYVAPAGSPYAQRSLPPHNLNAAPDSKYPYNYYVYAVARSLVVQAGPIAPWFGQPGLGLQFLLSASLSDLVQHGVLTRVDLEADPNW